MRASVVLSIMSLAVLAAACAAKPKPVLAKACPPPTEDQSYHAVIDSLAAHFGKRHLGYHVISEARTTDTQGDTVLHLTRIGPGAEEQPGPGQGKRLDVVLQPCTGKVLRFYEPG